VISRLLLAIHTGERDKWVSVLSTAEEKGANYCKVLKGKALFSVLFGTYIVTE
jgi:hypothetical protein